MKIKGQYQWTDYLATQLVHAQTSRFAKIFIFFCGMLVFSSMLYLFFNMGDQKIEDIIPILLFLLVFVLVFFISPIFYRKVVLPKQVKQAFAQQKNLSLPFEIEFTETGMNFSNAIGNNTWTWEYFTKWNENEDIIVLYQSDNVIQMIPKRLLVDQQQLDMVKSLLQKNIVIKATSRFQQG
jgi:YcxB-like protein